MCAHSRCLLGCNVGGPPLLELVNKEKVAQLCHKRDVELIHALRCKAALCRECVDHLGVLIRFD